MVSLSCGLVGVIRKVPFTVHRVLWTSPVVPDIFSDTTLTHLGDNDLLTIVTVESLRWRSVNERKWNIHYFIRKLIRRGVVCLRIYDKPPSKVNLGDDLSITRNDRLKTGGRGRGKERLLRYNFDEKF